MLVLDTETQGQWRSAAKQENTAALRQKALEHDLVSNSISVAPDDQRDVSNFLAQIGKPLASLEVERRLKLCNPNLVFKPSNYKNLKGIYLPKWERTATGGFEKRDVFICGMEAGIMPEFSVLHKTKKKVANPELFGKHKPTREIDWKEVDTFAGETRGWRTVLVRLLHQNIIREIDVRTHFEWAPSQESRKWANQTKETICLQP